MRRWSGNRGAVRAALLISMWAAVTFSAVEGAHAADCVVARRAGGGEARALVVGNGLAAVTELWVDLPGAPDRLVGCLPGRAETLTWAADGRVVLRVEPLSLPSLGLSMAPARTWALTSERFWRVEPEHGRAEAVAVSDLPEAWEGYPVQDGATGPPPAFRHSALAAVGQALNVASSAYSALHGWKFRASRIRFEEAAGAFWNLRRGPGGAPFLEAPLKAYQETLRQKARLADTEGRRWVCREHLIAVGDMLQVYAGATSGKRPASLRGLRGWLKTQGATPDDVKLMDVLFRPVDDWEPGRLLAYYYRPEAAEGEAILTSFFHRDRLVELVVAGAGFRLVDRRIGKAQIDSLMSVGEAYYASPADSVQAISVYEMVTGVAPDYAMGHCQLGYAHLKVGNLRRALKAFERAVTCDDRLPEAYLGLGLLFRKWPKGDYDAVRYFQEALQFRRDYVEARYNIAEIRYLQGELDAKRDIDKVLETDPQYAPAYKLMGLYQEDLRKDYEAAALYYAQYLSMRPDDKESRVGLGRAYLRARNYGRVLDLLESRVRSHPDEYELLPILAQACTKLEAYDRAEAYYDQYLKQIRARERYYYQDISLVATPEELSQYASVLGTPQESAFLARFWASRDPNLTTAANERQLEHYRRVWFARQNFGEREEPWDRRGEVYVRYGEPQHRSRSDDVNFDMSLAVQRVKERLANAIYGNALAPELVFRSTPGEGDIAEQLVMQGMSTLGGNLTGPVYPVRSMGPDISRSPGFSAEVSGPETAGQSSGESTVNAARDAPGVIYGSGTAASGVPWESWVYTDVGGGIEIVFTDEMGQGMYDYAPVPLDARIPLRRLAVLSQYSPENVVKNAIVASPDLYRSEENKNPLGFYYDLASFRTGDPEKTLVEVYVGVPHNMSQFVEEDRETRLDVVRKVALLNVETGAVYRRAGEIHFRSKGDLTSRTDGFVPDVIQLEVPPGSYRMEIDARESQYKRRARYRQDVRVPAYTSDSLRVSDLELAFQVEEGGGGQRAFRKGDLDVIPLPTRSYAADQSVFVYYEIYNLARDTFGRSRYRVSYDVTPKEALSGTGIISSLMRIGRNQREAVAVTSERQGSSEFEREYVALNVGKSRDGTMVLSVRVEDLNAGTAVQKQATFSVQR